MTNNKEYNLKILDLLKEMAEKQPDVRFGQLMHYLKYTAVRTDIDKDDRIVDCILFYMESEQIFNNLKRAKDESD